MFTFAPQHKSIKAVCMYKPYARLTSQSRLYGVIAQKGVAIPINSVHNFIVYPRCLQQTLSIIFGVLFISGIGLLELNPSPGNNACLNQHAYISMIIIKLMYWLVCYYFEVTSTC